MRWQRSCLFVLMVQAGVSCVQAQCVAGAIAPDVKSGPVRLMTLADTAGLMPAELAEMRGGAAAAAPGVSGVAAVVGNLIGNLIINRIHTGRQESVIKQRQWVGSAVERANPGDQLYSVLQKGLSAEGFADVHVDKTGDPFDMEQPGLLARIAEPYIMTAHLSYGWTGEADRIGWAKLHMRLWQKGGFKPVSCREYVYVGADSVAKEEGATDSMLIEQMVAESVNELSSMVSMDVRQLPPSKTVDANEAASSAQPTYLSASLPALGAQQQARKATLTSLTQRPDRWLAAEVADSATAQWWSLPKRLADVQVSAAK